MADNSSPDSKAIGGPKDGKYYILSAVAPKVIIGVDGVGNPWVPVIVDGKNNVVSPLVFALHPLRSWHRPKFALCFSYITRT